MKKFLALVLSLVFSLNVMSLAVTEEKITLNELFELCWEESCYPAGLLFVNCVVTETAQFRVDVWVDNTRVDYHLLSNEDWKFDTEYGILVSQSAFEKLVSDIDAPSRLKN